VIDLCKTFATASVSISFHFRKAINALLLASKEKDTMQPFAFPACVAVAVICDIFMLLYF
jgi:hypothetical protein